MTIRAWLLVGFSAVSLAAALFLPAMPQPVHYHDFADQRPLFGVANFLDVASNVGFLLVAVAGLAVVANPRTAFEERSERWPYAVFFAGMLLTAAGSAYYHLAPDNERLFWDRLPMTIAFMSLIAAQITERMNVRAGVALLLPMLFAGVASVLYWRATERAGVGNVIPYGVLQAYAVAALLLIALAQPSRYTRGGDIFWVLGAYAAAKLFELFDREVLAFGNYVSGHSLKHIAAAVGGALICRTLSLRAVRDPAMPGVRGSHADA